MKNSSMNRENKPIKWVENRLAAVSGLPGVGKTTSLEKIAESLGIPVIPEPLDDSFSFSEVKNDKVAYLEMNRRVIQVIRFDLLPEILKYPLAILDRYPLDTLVWLEFNLKDVPEEFSLAVEKIDQVLRSLYFVKIFLILERPESIPVSGLLNHKRYEDLFTREKELRSLFLSRYQRHCYEIVKLEDLEKRLKEFLCNFR